MGFAVQRDRPDDIQSIDRHSNELVYLIDRELTTAFLWGDLWVILARAGRFYVVFGNDMGSREIMEAVRDGAHDVLMESDPDDWWTEAIDHVGRSQQSWWDLYGGRGELDADGISGRSAALKSLGVSVQRLEPTDATVLIARASGTGKERVA